MAGGLAAAMIVLMSGLRIAAGGHFLSDVVMSILFFGADDPVPLPSAGDQPPPSPFHR